jgi:NADPH:quinone reductase-like Zn-dependent oxidoreductase
MYAIQFAALSGLEVITTASPQNHELLKSLGAKHTLDYRSSTVVQDISRLSGGRLEYILDCISEKGSTEAAVEALPGPGGKVVTLLPVDPTKLSKEVDLHVFALFKVAGKGFAFGGKTFPPSLEDKAIAEAACGKISKLLFEGKVKGNPVKVVGGLADAEKGFKLVNEGKVRAEKLVYEVIKE